MNAHFSHTRNGTGTVTLQPSGEKLSFGAGYAVALPLTTALRRFGITMSRIRRPDNGSRQGHPVQYYEDVQHEQVAEITDDQAASLRRFAAECAEWLRTPGSKNYLAFWRDHGYEVE